ncbi:MAG: hypothetical protein ACE366_12760 [Bradymonadia bacterium]
MMRVQKLMCVMMLLAGCVERPSIPEDTVERPGAEASDTPTSPSPDAERVPEMDPAPETGDGVIEETPVSGEAGPRVEDEPEIAPTPEDAVSMYPCEEVEFDEVGGALVERRSLTYVGDTLVQVKSSHPSGAPRSTERYDAQGRVVLFAEHTRGEAWDKGMFEEWTYDEDKLVRYSRHFRDPGHPEGGFMVEVQVFEFNEAGFLVYEQHRNPNLITDEKIWTYDDEGALSERVVFNHLAGWARRRTYTRRDGWLIEQWYFNDVLERYTEVLSDEVGEVEARVDADGDGIFEERRWREVMSGGHVYFTRDLVTRAVDVRMEWTTPEGRWRVVTDEGNDGQWERLEETWTAPSPSGEPAQWTADNHWLDGALIHQKESYYIDTEGGRPLEVGYRDFESEERPMRVRQRWRYDAEWRLLEQWRLFPGDVELSRAQKFIYDADGRLNEKWWWTDSTGTFYNHTHYIYDEYGREMRRIGNSTIEQARVAQRFDVHTHYDCVGD